MPQNGHSKTKAARDRLKSYVDLERLLGFVAPIHTNSATVDSVKKLAEKIPWREIDIIKQSIPADLFQRFGLNELSNESRLGRMILGAYANVSAVYAAEEIYLSKSEFFVEVAKKLEKILAELKGDEPSLWKRPWSEQSWQRAGPFVNTVPFIRDFCQTDPEMLERLDDVPGSLAKLAHWQEVVQDIAQDIGQFQKGGRRFDAGRYYFGLALAEAMAINTSVSIVFSVPKSKNDNLWLEVLKFGLELAGYDVFGIEKFLRDLRGLHRKTIRVKSNSEEFQVFPAGEARRSIPPQRGEQLSDFKSMVQTLSKDFGRTDCTSKEALDLPSMIFWQALQPKCPA